MWRNWTGEQVCTPAEVARPASTAEVVAAVSRARETGRLPVRVAGAGHSFTDAVLTDGTLLDLSRMSRVLDVDRAAGRVRVQAGITLHAMSEALVEHGLAFENLGDIDVQSVAGAVATGTHGTGSGLRNLSANVVGMQLVCADGTVRELDGGDELRAARVSIGALGVVTELTLQCQPAYVLRGHDAPLPLSEVLGALDEFADGARHFEMYVFPHSDLALTRTNEIVDAPPSPPGRVDRLVNDVLVPNVGLRAACEMGRRVPRAIPAIDRFMARAFSERVRVDRSHRIFASPRWVRFTEMEQAFPRAAASVVVPQIKAVLERYPVVFPIEVRFVAGDDALLSPAHGRDSVYIAVHNFRGMPWEAPFRAVQEIGDAWQARPHWGKRHFHTAATLAPRYEAWDAFADVRRSFDPAGTFANAYVRRVLGGES